MHIVNKARRKKHGIIVSVAINMIVCIVSIVRIVNIASIGSIVSCALQAL